MLEGEKKGQESNRRAARLGGLGDRRGGESFVLKGSWRGGRNPKL